MALVTFGVIYKNGHQGTNKWDYVVYISKWFGRAQSVVLGQFHL